MKMQSYQIFICLCCSDNVSALEMATPIAEELHDLETYGVEVYDDYHKTNSVVLSPVLCFLSDNPIGLQKYVIILVVQQISFAAYV